MTKLFTPSSTDLLRMIAAAEQKCDADIAHTEARACDRAAQALEAAVKAKRYAV